MPPLPQAVQKLYQLSNDMNSEIREMVEVIEKDQALTMKLLQIVNSAFYGLSQKVGTVSRAIVILGFKTLRSLALSLSVFKIKNMSDVPCLITMEGFWRHALASGTVGRIIAKKNRFKDPEEAFVAGLLHDIGKMVFMIYYPKEYNEVLQKASETKKKLFQLEKESFGIDHANLGAELCRYWKLPAILNNAIENHHQVISPGSKSQEEETLTYLIQAGNNLAKLAQIGQSGSPSVETDLIQNRKGTLNAADINKILLTLQEDMTKAEQFFELKKE